MSPWFAALVPALTVAAGAALDAHAWFTAAGCVVGAAWVVALGLAAGRDAEPTDGGR